MTRNTALTMLFLVAACGGGGGSSSTGGGGGPGTVTGPATVAEYCDRYFTELAGRWAACERGSAAHYAAVYDPALRCGDMVQAVTAGRATYDASRAGACLAHVATATCAALETLLDGTSPQADCLAAVAGKGAPGTECFSDESCASDLCFGAPLSCPSTCFTPLGQGGDCSGGAPCARGLACDQFASPPSTCQPLKAQNAPCMFDPECQPGLRCSYASGPPTCQPRGTAGATCFTDAYCAIGYQCGSNDECFQRKAAGDACAQGSNQCGPGLWCGPGASGTCIDGPVAGACTSVDGEVRPCIGGWCNLGTCASWRAESDACTVTGQCEPTATCDSNDHVCTTLCVEP
jgi:hypothetical protein